MDFLILKLKGRIGKQALTFESGHLFSEAKIEMWTHIAIHTWVLFTLHDMRDIFVREEEKFSLCKELN